MNFNQGTFRPSPIQPSYAVSDVESTLMRSVFSWMFIGLIVTGFVSMFVVNTPAISSIVFNRGLLIVLFIVELALVFWLSARVHSMSPAKAKTVFLTYSAINGITISPIAFVYTGTSIASTFFVTAGVFGAMAVYGYVTKRDLTGLGTFLFMGLTGIILASIVNIFIMSDMMSFMISCVGVIVFVGLTAYDVQKIKQMAYEIGGSTAQLAIIGALRLYLDFINLFIMLLRFLGDRR